mmetsp:Transcript_16705/g.2328  ORF Transcript_16705/g.2328 Transcript_16705/m.2328 type:complete len:114 (+) Transcript_16705:393-734(+)
MAFRDSDFFPDSFYYCYCLWDLRTTIFLMVYLGRGTFFLSYFYFLGWGMVVDDWVLLRVLSSSSRESSFYCAWSCCFYYFLGVVLVCFPIFLMIFLVIGRGFYSSFFTGRGAF